MGASIRGAMRSRRNTPTTKQAGVKDTSAVGRYPKGKSPYGVMDMAGNVWEWCLTKWRYDYILPPDDDPAGEDRACGAGRFLRGYDARNVRCACRDCYYPSSRNDDLGFRVGCVSPPS